MALDLLITLVNQSVDLTVLEMDMQIISRGRLDIRVEVGEVNRCIGLNGFHDCNADNDIDDGGDGEDNFLIVMHELLDLLHLITLSWSWFH